MHKLICFEGIDYAGKTSVAKIVAEKFRIIYGPRVANRYAKEEVEIHKNPDHLARFAFFMEEIAARSEEICQILPHESVIVDRYLLSVIAYHNIIIGKHLEEETDIDRVRPVDFTILVTVEETVLRKRMTDRPPRHPYESDPLFLLCVQEEFLRLADKGTSIVIDTSTRTAEETTRIVVGELDKRGFITPRSTSNEET